MPALRRAPRASTTTIAALLALTFATVSVAPVAAQLPRDIAAVRGSAPLILIFFTARDDPRPFELNLEMSLIWDELERLGVVAIDVTPGRYNVSDVARELGMPGEAFGLVYMDRSGEIIVRTTDTRELAAIVDQIADAERAR